MRALIPNSTNSRKCLTAKAVASVHMQKGLPQVPSKTKEVHSLWLRTLTRSHSIDLFGVSLSANKPVDGMCVSRKSCRISHEFPHLISSPIGACVDTISSLFLTSMFGLSHLNTESLWETVSHRRSHFTRSSQLLQTSIPRQTANWVRRKIVVLAVHVGYLWEV